MASLSCPTTEASHVLLSHEKHRFVAFELSTLDDESNILCLGCGKIQRHAAQFDNRTGIWACARAWLLLMQVTHRTADVLHTRKALAMQNKM